MVLLLEQQVLMFWSMFSKTLSHKTGTEVPPPFPPHPQDEPLDSDVVTANGFKLPAINDFSEYKTSL